MCLKRRSLLPYKVYQLKLRGRYCLLLPKLAPKQMSILVKRLVMKGCVLRASDPIVARSKEGVLRVSPAGMCWASFDPSDLVLPAVPEILESVKNAVPVKTLAAKYFAVARAGGGTVVRLSTRVESSTLWDELRSAGECGLTPDEHAVVTFLIGRADSCTMVTDFPVDGSRTAIVGRRRFFDSKVESGEAVRTLRQVGVRGPRNSYVRREGMLRMEGFSAPARSELLGIFAGIGEWCSFAPE